MRGVAASSAWGYSRTGADLARTVATADELDERAKRGAAVGGPHEGTEGLEQLGNARVASEEEGGVAARRGDLVLDELRQQRRQRPLRVGRVQ